jgi:hypothetical protein
MDMDASEPINVEALRLPEPGIERRPNRERNHIPKHRQGEKFIRGPIPMAWLTSASSLPGKTLAVGLAVWYLAGLKKTNRVRVTGSTLKLFGVERKAGYRGLAALEAVGLIRVERRAGACPMAILQDSQPSR